MESFFVYFYSNYYRGGQDYDSYSYSASPSTEASGNVMADEVNTKSAPSPKKSCILILALAPELLPI